MKQDRAAELNEKIQAVMQVENWLGAIELVQDQTELVRVNWELSWNLGWAYFKLDRLKEARQHLLRAAKLSPENPICHWALGTVYRRLKNYKKAEASLTEALSIKDSHLARIALALTYLEQGKVDEAEKIHLEGLKLKPGESERYKSYAAFLSDVGREREAQRMYRKAQSLRRGKEGSRANRA